MKKVVIAGSRDFHDYDLVMEKFLGLCLGQVEIVSGGAKGVDALGERLARELGYPLKVFPADWTKHGKAAGPIRNRQMAEYADVLVAFWDGQSPGTRNMIRVAVEKRLEIHLFFV
ncbi:MAG: DUF2493 domain-containing protein [Gammaproteobacteria bacterium]|nr:MAG: DUF2493 domain-containing protein [Gammaproteobacteria bacterium]